MNRTFTLTTPVGIIDFLPLKTAYFHVNKTLVVADLHLGKAETFQRFGIPIPIGHSLSDLDRLTSAINFTSPSRVLILGDFFHSPAGVTNDLLDLINQWTNRQPCPIFLIKGNHDRLTPYHRLSMTVLDFLDTENILFCHHPKKVEGKLVVAGHLHPVFRIGAAGKGMRFPCFLYNDTQLILPSFGEFTGGQLVSGKGYLVFLSTPEAVIEWSPS